MSNMSIEHTTDMDSAELNNEEEGADMDAFFCYRTTLTTKQQMCHLCSYCYKRHSHFRDMYMATLGLLVIVTTCLILSIASCSISQETSCAMLKVLWASTLLLK